MDAAHLNLSTPAARLAAFRTKPHTYLHRAVALLVERMNQPIARADFGKVIWRDEPMTNARFQSVAAGIAARIEKYGLPFKFERWPHVMLVDLRTLKSGPRVLTPEQEMFAQETAARIGRQVAVQAAEIARQIIRADLISQNQKVDPNVVRVRSTVPNAVQVAWDTFDEDRSRSRAEQMKAAMAKGVTENTASSQHWKWQVVRGLRPAR